MAQPVARPLEDRARLGIVMMLAAWLLLSLVDTSVKWLVIAGIPALQLAFMRYFVHFLIATGAMLRTGRDAIRWPARNAGLVFLRAGLLVSATVTNFFALRYLSLTVTSSILFSAPIIVSLLAGPLLGERVGRWRWFAILLGFAGVLIVIRPFGQAFHWATLLIVYNAFALALFSIITRRISGVTSAETMQFWMGALGTLVLAPGAVWTWQNPETPRDWVILGLIGAWGWAGHELFARAHGFAEANALMPYSYVFILYLTTATWLVFGDLPDGFTVLGAVIIMSSGLLIWWRENHKGAINVS